MIDLTTLSKDEVIKELEFVRSEWFKDEKEQIDIFRKEETKLKDLHMKKRQQVAEKLKEDCYARMTKEISVSQLLKKQVQQPFSFYLLIFNIIIVVIYFCSFISQSTIKNILILEIIFILISISWRFLKTKYRIKKLKQTDVTVTRIPGFPNDYRAFVTNISSFLNKAERSIWIDKLHEYNNEMNSLIQKYNKATRWHNFNNNPNYRRTNLGSRYYGHEHVLIGYLKDGLADNFKEALLLIEEDWHRNRVVNAQRQVANEVARQSAAISRQISNQSAEITNQSNRIRNLENEISYLS